MPFRYRLQKILDFRINQREEQRMKVQKAQSAVAKARNDIQMNNQAIKDTQDGMRSANPAMYEFYDNYLKHLWEEAQRLEEVLKEKQRLLDIETKKLVKCEQGVKVLEKHKEKSRELYREEEKKAELNQFSELGVTRFYRKKQENIEEESQAK